MQLTYNNQTSLAGGCFESRDSGVSRFGFAVIEEMNRLGMIIDLSHAGHYTCLDAIKQGIIKSAHDVSDGGVAVNIAESIMSSKGDLGADIHINRKLRNDEMLFGECQSLIVVTVSEESLHELVILAQRDDIHTETIGRVTDSGKLVINDLVDIKRKKLEKVYYNTLEDILSIH